MYTDSLQSVTGMSMIPIVGEDCTRISSPDSIKFLGVPNYGEVSFKNVNDGISIMPSNTTIITKKNAQDHCTSMPIVFNGKDKKTAYNSCCIQEHQHGHIVPDDNLEYSILPLGLRKLTFDKGFRTNLSFNKLWDGIRSWKNGFAEYASDARLNNAFQENEDMLDQFAAQFEPVKNQVGAFIYFNEYLVGVEVMPTNEYWQYYWKRLIRGCYGLERIRLAKLGHMPMKRVTYKRNEGNDLLIDIEVAIKKIQDTMLNCADVNEGIGASDNSKYMPDGVYSKMAYIENSMKRTDIGDIIYIKEDSKEKPIYMSLCM